MKGFRAIAGIGLIGASVCAGCSRAVEPPTAGDAVAATSPCEVALVPAKGDADLDRAIRRLQREAIEERTQRRALFDLGQRFIAKARVTNDAGFYTLADESARCLESVSPDNNDALLLRGHILHQLHRFKEAETIARRLVAVQGSVLDYGLLGDTLMEQGRLDEAVAAYQRMIDLKPYYQSYIRVAHVRWLKGNLEGARRLMDTALKAASPRDPEAIAWAYSRLALYDLQAAEMDLALQDTTAALRYVQTYAPALLVQGRALMAIGQTNEALNALHRAVAANPIPEYQWTLADALRATGQATEASGVEEDLERRGATTDPRTLALYLATRGERLDVAVALANKELQNRGDVFTLDAAAWTLAASGRTAEAEPLMTRALAEGTMDARLFYHAGTIAATAGRAAEARRWLRRADALHHMLLPSESQHVTRQLAALTGE